MKHAFLIAALLLAACRTEIKPLIREEPAKKKVRNTVNDCSVRDYPTATDLPSGSQNIGWITVKRLATDEETFEALRKEVCAKGGDAMSQMHWIRASGASVADPPVELEANAWVTP